MCLKKIVHRPYIDQTIKLLKEKKMIWTAYFAMLFATLFMPAKVQLVAILVNIFVPDPLPYVDEFIQGGILLKSLISSE